MNIGASIGGYGLAEVLIKVVDQSWLRADMEVALLEKRAEEATAAMQECLYSAGIPFDVHVLEKLGDRVRLASHPFLFAES